MVSLGFKGCQTVCDVSLQKFITYGETVAEIAEEIERKKILGMTIAGKNISYVIARDEDEVERMVKAAGYTIKGMGNNQKAFAQMSADIGALGAQLTESEVPRSARRRRCPACTRWRPQDPSASPTGPCRSR